MNVREAARLLKRAKEVKIVWNGNAVDLDKDDMLMMDAYGNYAVDEIATIEEGCVELIIAMRPVKEGVA